MSHSYLYSHLYSPGRPLRAWQAARGAVNRERAGPQGPREGTIKGPGSNLLPRRLKGKLVIVSSQRNTFQSQWLRRQRKRQRTEVTSGEMRLDKEKLAS